MYNSTSNIDIEELISYFKNVLAISPNMIKILAFQTEDLCITAIRAGLKRREFIYIDWTERMEREWTLRNV